MRKDALAARTSQFLDSGTEDKANAASGYVPRYLRNRDGSGASTDRYEPPVTTICLLLTPALWSNVGITVLQRTYCKPTAKLGGYWATGRILGHWEVLVGYKYNEPG